ncbi:MAG TPA: winged helix-turn-helix domain-containing protein, partial [Crenalkalicoccus sp.]|nr:winged helix-turn-helix domain-containing protein [Crenalkalicoccus sp.]
MTPAEDEEWVFGRFVLHPRRRELLADGVAQEIGSRAFDVLLALAGSEGALATKEALLDAAWSGVVVGEDNLYAQVATLRRVLGPDRDIIQTVPGRGYRFTARVLRRPAGGAAPAPRRALAGVVVLPFLDLGSEPGAERAADAITEALTTDLARALTGMQVVSRATAFAYRDRAVEARRVGEELGVRYVLEGSVVVRGGRVRANAQLIEAVADAHLWAERFDRPCGSDLLAAQDEVVVRIARLAALQLIAAEAARAGASPAASRDAPGLVLRGRAEMA